MEQKETVRYNFVYCTENTMKVTGETCNFKAYLWQDIKNNSRRRLWVLSNWSVE